MKVLGVITARGGSKRIPRKNVKLFCGRPLISYIIDAAHDSCLSRVVVSTDCEEIAKVAREFGAEVLMRPAKLAQDDTPSGYVIDHAIGAINGRFDAVVTLQPTSPLLTGEDIDGGILALRGADVIRSLSTTDVHPEWLYDSDMQPVIKDDLARMHLSQDLPQYYTLNGAFTIRRLSVYGKILVPLIARMLNEAFHIIPPEHAADIDTIDDFHRAEDLYARTR